MLIEMLTQARRLRRKLENRAAGARSVHELDAWGKKYLQSYLTLPASGLHRWLAGTLQTLHTRRGTFLAIVAPRGSAKSTWASLLYLLWCALNAYERYIVLISDTQSQARLLLEAIKTELEDNVNLTRDYPQAAGEGSTWQQDRIRLQNGVVIEALGTGSKIRGRRNRAERPSLIVIDDPENDENVTSTLQRDRTWAWFNRAVANAGTPRTNVLALGTALHRDCLVLRLQRTAGWHGETFQAIRHWPARMDLWSQWELIYQDWSDPAHEAKARRFYEERREALHAGAQLLWPENEDLYTLMCLRATIGAAAFESEKQGNPVNPEACEWPSEYFDYPGFWFEQWPEGITIKTIALDPSKGGDQKRGDFSAYVRLGMDGRRTLYVEADLRNDRDAERIVADGVDHVRNFKPDGFSIETNVFAQLFVVLFKAAGEKEKVHLPIYTCENSVKKEVRIRRLTTFLAQHKLRFKSRSPGTALLVQQMRDFPVGDHDDGPDALEMALRLLIDIHNGHHHPPRPTRLVAV